MRYRTTVIALTLAFSCAVLLLSFTYGPFSRVYATPPRAVTVDTDSAIYPALKSAGLKGRILILFTPLLSPQIGTNTSTESIELAMRHSLFRTVYQVVPDSAWPKVFSQNLVRPMPTPPKISDTDVTLLLEAGRITVMPLSRFWPVEENVVVIIDPAAWTPDERAHILRLMQSGNLATDFVVIINGQSDDLQQYGAYLRGK